MNEYTASNGVKVYQHASDGGSRMSVRDDNPRRVPGHVTPQTIRTYLDPRQVDGLREFFRAEEDEQLGRWRWPHDPDYVVYPLGLDPDGFRYASAVHEPSRVEGKWQEGQSRVEPPTRTDDLGILAVAAYFAAHPEPKPWENAEPGEVWVLTWKGREYAGIRNPSPDFRLTTGTILLVASEDITAAHRIYPPADPS